jgi:hypothetical protein
MPAWGDAKVETADEVAPAEVDAEAGRECARMYGSVLAEVSTPAPLMFAPTPVLAPATALEPEPEPGARLRPKLKSSCGPAAFAAAK